MINQNFYKRDDGIIRSAYRGFYALPTKWEYTRDFSQWFFDRNISVQGRYDTLSASYLEMIVSTLLFQSYHIMKLMWFYPVHLRNMNKCWDHIWLWKEKTMKTVQYGNIRIGLSFIQVVHLTCDYHLYTCLVLNYIFINLGHNWFLDKFTEYSETSVIVQGWDYSDEKQFWPNSSKLFIVGNVYAFPLLYK